MVMIIIMTEESIFVLTLSKHLPRAMASQRLPRSVSVSGVGDISACKHCLVVTLSYEAISGLVVVWVDMAW